MSEDFLSGEKFPALTWPEVGATHKFQVIEVGKVQDRKPDGTLITWDSDGSPKWVYPTTVLLNDEKHTVWVRGNLLKRIKEACQAVGITSLPGTWLTVRREADGEPRKGFNPAHLFKVKAEVGTLAPTQSDPFDSAEDPF
jgi:hypothetical protein